MCPIGHFLTAEFEVDDMTGLDKVQLRLDNYFSFLYYSSSEDYTNHCLFRLPFCPT